VDLEQDYVESSSFLIQRKGMMSMGMVIRRRKRRNLGVESSARLRLRQRLPLRRRKKGRGRGQVGVEEKSKQPRMTMGEHGQQGREGLHHTRGRGTTVSSTQPYMDISRLDPNLGNVGGASIKFE